MKIRNRLRQMLHDLGIKSMVPTDELLKNKLGGMTIHRFNKILNNDSKTELSVLEADHLRGWLSQTTGQAKDDIQLLEVPSADLETV